jgi:ornithine cyclodeaminase/alanine dehydrogenase-like protein (mu-crystallin family)
MTAHGSNARTLRVITAEEVRAALSIGDVIEALESALRIHGFPDTPERTQLPTPHGTLITMPATAASGSGVKVVSVVPSNPARALPLVHAIYVAFTPETMEPFAVMDASALTERRTSAISAIATRHLARADASRLVVFGAGVQAHAHLDAMCAVRDIRSLDVVAPRRERAEALAARARANGIDARVARPQAVCATDIVCTCTTSSRPLFDGGWLAPRTHVNAVGVYRPDARELDDTTVRRARIVVETRSVALEEAGDLIIPLDRGTIGPEAIVAELPDLIRDGLPASARGDITVFKSVGHGIEDLIVADAVLRAIDAQ